MEPAAGSALFYLYVFGFCELGRQLVRTTLHNSFVNTFFFEFLGTLQICACIYEGPLIVRHYGFPAFWLNVFILASLHGLTAGPTAMLIPCRVIKSEVDVLLLYGKLLRTRAWQESSRFAVFATRLVAEICAAAVTYHFVRTFWMLGLTADHANQYENFACTIRYSLPLVAVGFAEMFLTMLLCAAYTELDSWAPNWSVRVARAAILATLICVGVLLTGGPVFMNPAQGLGRILVCEGLHLNQHFLVQWLLPTVGWWLGADCRHFLRKHTVGHRRSPRGLHSE